ncbi:hypothetical protein HYR99_16065 [Candidatus Poribacteria bacterium]|nr:hypothetical protein [Candidatus Poribacteria bacterium]
MNQTALQQKKLLENFFQAEKQRKQKEAEIQSRKAKAEKTAEDALNQARASADSRRQREIEALNRAKAEIDEALTVYQQLESDLSGFTRPKHQLNLDDEPIKQLQEILEEAKANFLLQISEGNDRIHSCVLRVKQFRGEILQKIDDYRRTKSEASSAIQKMRSEWQSLQNYKNAKYIRSELATLQSQVNLGEQHFQADTISDYRRVFEISGQVSSKVIELTQLANQRVLEHRRAMVGYGLLGSFLGGLGRVDELIC